MSCEDRIEGGAEVCGVGGAAAGVGVVELAAIGEFAVGAEEEEIGRAGGGVGYGDGLRFTEEDREIKACRACEFGDRVRRFSRVASDVLCGDADGADPFST